MAEELDEKAAARQAAQDKANKVFAVVVLVPLAIGALVAAPMVMRHSSPAVTSVLDRVNADEGVQRAMGGPISAGWSIEEDKRYRGQKDVVHFEIPLEGAHHGGVAQATGVETGGVWGWSELKVVVEGGTTLRLIGE